MGGGFWICASASDGYVRLLQRLYDTSVEVVPEVWALRTAATTETEFLPCSSCNAVKILETIVRYALFRGD